MVRDLIMDIKERDLSFVDKSNSNLPVFDTVWGDIFDEDKTVDALICNILIPEAYWKSIDYQDNEITCRFTSAYVPDTRNFRVRLVAMRDGAYYLFPNIRGDFGIQVNSYALSANIASPIAASMLPYIDIDGQFLVKIVKSTYSEVLDRAYLYSAKCQDIEIGYSDDQSSQLLSLCAPGNSYRYPTTGVGISRYLNAIISHTDLYSTLQTQFDDDNKTIKSADFDNESGNLEVVCNPESEQEDEDLESVDNLNSDFFDSFDDDYVRRNIVLNELSDSDFFSVLRQYDRILNIILFQDSSVQTTRIASDVNAGRFDAEGNVVMDDVHLIVSATLEAGSIIMFDDELEDDITDAPVFIVNDNDETRLYTALVGQPYWISETCHKCLILNKRSTIKYTIHSDQYQAGKGLFYVSQSSDNIKNMCALVQDNDTGRVLGIVSSNTNISDVVLDEITQHIYATQLK